MIFMDDSHVKVSGVTLPGIVKSLEIKDNAKVEEQEIEGSSTKVKQANGYEDAKITIEILLDDSPNQTKEQKLSIIQNLFKKAGQTQPTVHQIVNEHTSQRRIVKVIFKSLSTKEQSKRNRITASLEFWTYNPVKITATRKKTKSTTSTPTSLNTDFESYLENRGSSPAIDDASTAEYESIVAGIPYTYGG